MKTTVETIINHLNCSYTMDGENIANLRRSQLQRLGEAIGIKGEMSKNQLLTLIIPRLDSLGSDKELSKAQGVAK